MSDEVKTAPSRVRCDLFGKDFGIRNRLLCTARKLYRGHVDLVRAKDADAMVSKAAEMSPLSQREQSAIAKAKKNG